MVTHSQHDPLWAITSRLLETASEDLPFEIPHISNSLLGCGDALRIALIQGKGSSAGLAWNKIKTKITSLLNSKKPEDRWAGTVLMKTTVGICAHNILPSCGLWVRVLLTNLPKSDPPSTKKLSIAVLTQIFMLTDGHQTHIRELTTPSMPNYISACIGIALPKSTTVSMTQFNTIKGTITMILESFCILLPRYPTIFRPHLTHIKSMLSQLIVPHSTSGKQRLISALQILSNDLYVQQRSQILLTLLSCCASKGEAGNDWSNYLSVVISETHFTASQVFRSVVENWTPLSDKDNPSLDTPSSYDGPPAMSWSTNILELPHWSGIQAGCSRLCALVRLLNQFLSGESPTLVQISLGRLANLITRLLSVLSPFSNASSKAMSNSSNNSQIGDNERQIMWSELAQIHIAAIDLTTVALERFGNLLANFRLTCIERIAAIFGTESYHRELRVSLYAVARVSLVIGGQTAQKSHLELLSPLIQASCDDLLYQNLSKNHNTNVKESLKSLIEKTADSAAEMNTESKCFDNLFENAERLLNTLLTKVPSKLISDSLRSRLDQTSIVRRLSSSMVASVLNPMKHSLTAKPHSSILPLLARVDSTDLAVECLIRPRRPILIASERHEPVSGEDDISKYGYLEDRVSLEYEIPKTLEQSSISMLSRTLDGTNRNLDNLGNPLHVEESPKDQHENELQAQDPANTSHDLGTRNDTLIESSKANHLSPAKRQSSFSETNETLAKKARTVLESGPKAASENSSDPEPNKLSPVDEDSNWPTSEISSAPRVSSVEKEKTSLRLPRDESDDSDEDFVIPPLSMDPDSDGEGEEKSI